VSGKALIITDSFPVIPDADGIFRKSFTNSWKTFGFKLSGKYALSGSAVLVSGLTPGEYCHNCLLADELELGEKAFAGDRGSLLT
jgi:hypothetical protein